MKLYNAWSNITIRTARAGVQPMSPGLIEAAQSGGDLFLRDSAKSAKVGYSSMVRRNKIV